MMKRVYPIIMACIMHIATISAQECPTITLSAEPSTVTLQEPAVTLLGAVEGGSGYYTWYKDDEVVSEGAMSLGEFVLYYFDEEVSDTPGNVTYKLNITNKQCDVTEQVTVTVATPVNADETGAVMEKEYTNLTGLPVRAPLKAGIYVVREGAKTYKIILR